MTKANNFVLLAALYTAQGLPYGFQAKTLPVILRLKGTSLHGISLSGILGLPWLLKLLWAPVVDSLFWPTVGRRRSYLLPTQALLGRHVEFTLVAANLNTSFPL